MEFFTLLVLSFLGFVCLFLIFHLFRCLAVLFIKSHSKKWSKNNKISPGKQFSTDYHRHDPNLIYNNLQYNNSVNSMSLNMDHYDTQLTTSDNCDTPKYCESEKGCDSAVALDSQIATEECNSVDDEHESCQD